MVLPILAGLGLAVARFAPRIIPIARRAVPFARRAISKITVKRAIIGSLIFGAALESPSIRQALKKTPTAPFKVGKAIGAKFETAVEREVKERPKGKVRKALEIGGIAGIAGAGAVLGARALRARARRERDIAVLPSEASVIPALRAGPIVPAPGIGAAPQKAIITPAAIEVPKKKKRPIKRQQRVSPLIINQIQIDN